MMKGGIKFDILFSEYMGSMDYLTDKVIPSAVVKALWELGWVVIKDSIKVEPTVPFKIGDLRASGIVEVDEALMELSVGFNIVYATKMHEAPTSWNWTTPGSGPKYLEIKLQMFKDKYMSFVAGKVSGMWRGRQ